MVVSVGPYMLISRRPRDQRAAVPPGRRSPPTPMARTVGYSASGRLSRSAGVLSRMSTSRSRSSAPNRSGESTSSRSTRCSVAPDNSATKISSSEASKAGENVCSRLLRGVAPSVRTVADSRFAAPACVTTTPLGRPVEPEV